VVFPPFLRALNSRNYRLFFGGQILSLLGNWMTLTASSWLIYELSRNPFLVGLLAFSHQIPVLLLAPIGGIWGDRVNRQRLMWWLNLASATQSSLLALIAFSGWISVGWLLALAMLRGLINAVEFPTRQSFIVDLVDEKSDLPNAIALNSSMFNVARLAGPALAGWIIATRGPEVCYGLDAVSYVGILLALLAMRTVPRRERRRQPRHPWTDLREGFSYVRRSPSLRPPLLLVPLIALAGFTANILAPVFARDIFEGGSVMLGHMYSAMGAGALVGAGVLASRRNADGLPRWVSRGGFAVVLGMAGFAVSDVFVFSLLCLALNGFGTVLCMAGSNTLIQSHVADDKRSRVMGLFAMGQGMFPVGALLTGVVAATVGPRWAVALGAATVSVAVVQFALRASRLPGAGSPTRPAPLPSDSTL
jgi:MFS family permease